jgi:mRNA-degrading endonuclease RelE of RelBE toxin-antitoxin system
MKWRLDFSKDALKFLTRNKLKEDFIIDRIKLALRKFAGENINIDIKKLKGDWEGFYRIREGKLRIIVEFYFEDFRVYIEKIDWRGSTYK